MATTRSWSFRIRRFYRHREQHRLPLATKYRPVCHRHLLRPPLQRHNRRFLIPRRSQRLNQPIRPACHHHNQPVNPQLNLLHNQPRNHRRNRRANPLDNLHPSHPLSQRDNPRDSPRDNHRRSHQHSFRCMCCRLSQQRHPS